MKPCEYTTRLQPDQPMRVRLCGEPASVNHEGMWYCEDHYDITSTSIACDGCGNPPYWCDCGAPTRA